MFGKTPQEYEEPLSNLFYSISYYIAKNINVDPNVVTSIRLILMLIVYYLVYKTNYKLLAGFLFIFCYFMDHLDGEMARQNNTASIFGDYYDHITDNLYILPIIYFMYLKFTNHKYFKYILIVFLILFITSTILISCQELYLSKNKKSVESKALNKLQGLCIIKDFRKIRYLGLGLLHILLLYLIIV